jgi:hypothetical protein
MRQQQDKNLPFQIIHRFIHFVRQTHRSESARESSMKFSDDELVIISHLEQAATDLRCANPELIAQAKKIISESSFVPEVSDSKRFLLACIELLLIEVRARQKNPALYDFLFSGTLWFYYNRDKLPNEVVKEIADYLAYGNPYQSPEDAKKSDEYLDETIAYFMKRPLSVDEFVREKYHEMPDYERKDFLHSKSVKNWTAKWYAEYVKVQKHVSVRSFQNRVSELRKAERERLKKELVD